MSTNEEDDIPADSDMKMAIGRRMQLREEERLSDVQKRKAELEKNESSTEKTSYFMQSFKTGVEDINRLVDAAGDQPKAHLASYFDDIFIQYQELQKYVTDSSMFLSSYDIDRKQKDLKALHSEMTAKREALIPKKKFAFKSKKKQVAPKEVVTNDITDASVKVDIKYEANEYVLHSKESKTISIQSSEIEGKDINISKVSGCTIQIKGVPSAVHLTDIRDSTIMSGPCSR